MVSERSKKAHFVRECARPTPNQYLVRGILLLMLGCAAMGGVMYVFHVVIMQHAGAMLVSIVGTWTAYNTAVAAWSVYHFLQAKLHKS
ncbi:MAG TPA: hypothetical protein VGP72_06260 [Planctomycetota bacterium]|jgi:hypothetical protein